MHTDVSQLGKINNASPMRTSLIKVGFYIELHRDAHWNAWHKEEEAAKLERAHAVMDEWERAEPPADCRGREADAETAEAVPGRRGTPRPGEPLGVVA
jgi:hypothetical protein